MARLFLTCWLIYTLHFATNIAREAFLALAIGDHLSFRVDEYANMHFDLFEKEGYGWHIGANPGASMIAAVPYAVAKPIIDHVVERTNRARQESGVTNPPSYQTPWSLAREFYEEAWRRGYDVKLGMAAFVMQAFCMAPISALGVVAMFHTARHCFLSDKQALWLALLYAFGTPVFFRTGFLNHNMMMGHFCFIGLLLLWNPSRSQRFSIPARYSLAGLCAGTAVLLDYSGAVLAMALAVYGLLRRIQGISPKPRCIPRDLLRHAAFFTMGALGPVLLLWFYQWRSFGHPFYPGQHWMPPVPWIELGYQGVTWPQLELVWMLAFDYRFGLFVSCPLFLLALVSPFISRRNKPLIPTRELTVLLVSSLAIFLFFGGVQYTRLQFSTGIRYLAPLFPFLFLASSVVIVRLPWKMQHFLAVVSIAQSWCLAMYRDVERGWGMAEPILHVFIGGLQLPALTTLTRLGGAFGERFSVTVSPIPLFLLVGAVLYGIWCRRPLYQVVRK